MLIKKLLLVIFLVVVITPAKAEWVMVGTESAQGETHYFDPETTKKNGPFRKVWVLSSYGKKLAGGYRSVKSFYEFDCMEERARSYTMLLYTDEMATGDVIGAQHDKLKEWSTYPTGSIFSHIAEAVCVN
jgi:surface-adhesin protein E